MLLLSTGYTSSVQAINYLPSVNAADLLGSTATTSSSSPLVGSLTVIKKVIDNTTQDVPTPLPSEFKITVTVEGRPLLTFDGQDFPGTTIPNLPAGSFYNVSETFDPDFSISTTRVGCEGFIASQIPSTCTITNTFNGLDEGVAVTEALQITGGEEAVSVEDTAVAVTEALPIQSLKGDLKDPPFEYCKTTPALEIQEVGGSTGQEILFPSSALYSIRGEASLSRILNNGITGSGGSSDSNVLTFSILNDLKVADSAMSAISDPIYNGEIIKGTFPIGSNIVDFDVRDIKTDCKFITLIEPLGQDKDDNIYPLGEPGEKPRELKIVTDKKDTALLSSFRPGSNPQVNIVTDSPKAELLTSTVNPPFRQCNTAVQPVQATGIVGSNANPGAQFAEYIISGKVDPGQLGDISGTRDYQLLLTVDIVEQDDDLVKIVNNNNILLKATLIKDPGRDSAVAVDFPLDEVSTICRGIGFADTKVVARVP